ncbi:MAG: methylmalonyl-CoA epimerase [Cytophagales bacterium]|nr:methylmalonyl-CoA epimerase [Cytophagales bacterium]
MKKLEHIGIAVKDLDAANALFAKLFGRAHYKIEEVEKEGVRTSFFDLGNVKIELVAATRSDSAIAKFIEKRGEGLHHLAFESEGIETEMQELKAKEFTLLSEKPFAGADNKNVAFIHPKTTNHVLIELCQERE